MGELAGAYQRPRKDTHVCTRVHAYVRRAHGAPASVAAPRHKVDPLDRRRHHSAVVELRQIVFMKVNRRSSRGNCGDVFVRSLHTVRTVLLPPCVSR